MRQNNKQRNETMEPKNEFLEMIDEVNGFCTELQTFDTWLKIELNNGARPKDMMHPVLYHIRKARNMLSNFFHDNETKKGTST